MSSKQRPLRHRLPFVMMLVATALGTSALLAEEKPASKPADDFVRIAVVQQNTVPGEVATNRDKALQSAERAINGKADMIVFHEALTVGYVDNIRELAEAADGQTTKAFQELLKRNETDALILYGLIEREGGDCYTSAVVVGRDGIVATYRKTHLWWDAEGVRHEPTFFKPGNQLVTFDLKGHKSGIMICYDGDFPEMTRAYANRDCSMLFWPNNRYKRGHDEVKDLAYRNSMIIACSNCCGMNEQGNMCSGGSNITDRDGSLLKEIWNEEGIIYADVQPATVLQARQKNPWFNGQRQDLYGR